MSSNATIARKKYTVIMIFCFRSVSCHGRTICISLAKLGVLGLELLLCARLIRLRRTTERTKDCTNEGFLDDITNDPLRSLRISLIDSN